MTARVASRAIRQRKLSTKHNLPVIRESEIDMSNFDDGAQHNVPKVETGVEKAEETEHHLQQAMAAAAGGNIAAMSIPTPETIQSHVQYDRMYPQRFEQPVTYIRFSSTVEDSIGAPYCMTAEDDVWLKNFNHGKPKHQHCSDDTFEELFSSFEETSQAKQPFSGVDNPPPLSFEEMEQAFEESITEIHRHFARDVYEYWKKLRVERLNRPLLPTLKCEAGLESDETDPYVCFRRRELRQTRKTRNRDAQVTEKLKKLRRELEDARFLVHNVQRREQLRIDQLKIDREIFDQRSKVKDSKRNLGIKGDDEDLINQKPSPKPKPPLNATVHRGMQGSGLKPQLTRADGRPPDLDLISLQETKARKDEEINRFIEESLIRHQNWNKGYVDVTWRPITPPLDSASQQKSFRPAVTEYLPSPPASASDEGDKAKELPTLPMPQQTPNQPAQPLSRPQSAGSMMVYNAQRKAFENNSEITVRYSSPPSENFLAPSSRAPSFRRRVGRGGRLMIDRRGVKRRNPEENNLFDGVDDRYLDRFKYDIESDDEDETIVTDPFDSMSIRYRVALFASPAASRQRAIAEGQHAQAQAHANAAAAAHAQAQVHRSQ